MLLKSGLKFRRLINLFSTLIWQNPSNNIMSQHPGRTTHTLFNFNNPTNIIIRNQLKETSLLRINLKKHQSKNYAKAKIEFSKTFTIMTPVTHILFRQVKFPGDPGASKQLFPFKLNRL